MSDLKPCPCGSPSVVTMPPGCTDPTPWTRCSLTGLFPEECKGDRRAAPESAPPKPNDERKALAAELMGASETMMTDPDWEPAYLHDVIQRAVLALHAAPTGEPDDE